MSYCVVDLNFHTECLVPKGDVPTSLYADCTEQLQSFLERYVGQSFYATFNPYSTDNIDYNEYGEYNVYLESWEFEEYA